MPRFSNQTRFDPTKGRSDERDVQSAKSKKRTADLAGLFESLPRLRARVSYDTPKAYQFQERMTAARGDPNVDGFFANFSKKKSDAETSVYQEFSDVTEQYCEKVQVDFIDQLEAARDLLLNRMDGLDADGNALDTIPGLPTQEAIEAMESELHSLIQPFGEDVLQLRSKDADGATTHKQVNLADSLEAIQKQMATKLDEERQMKAKIDEIDVEMQSLIDDLLNDRDGAIKDADKKLEDAYTKSMRDLRSIVKQSVDDIKSVRAEEQAFSEKRKTLLQSFLSLTG